MLIAFPSWIFTVSAPSLSGSSGLGVNATFNFSIAPTGMTFAAGICASEKKPPRLVEVFSSSRVTSEVHRLSTSTVFVADIPSGTVPKSSDRGRTATQDAPPSPFTGRVTPRVAFFEMTSR